MMIPKYVIGLHPYWVRDLRSARKPNLWYDVAAAGAAMLPPVRYPKALGVYNGVIIIEDSTGGYVRNFPKSRCPWEDLDELIVNVTHGLRLRQGNRLEGVRHKTVAVTENSPWGHSGTRGPTLIRLPIDPYGKPQ